MSSKGEIMLVNHDYNPISKLEVIYELEKIFELSERHRPIIETLQKVIKADWINPGVHRYMYKLSLKGVYHIKGSWEIKSNINIPISGKIITLVLDIINQI
ncbi:gamma protein [Koolpinyah virus]|uniref:Gamma protein n=1 Tax=Koolpinyah virus TaxID=1550518 RepID=A0A096ZGU7_9RHAB|nr:gamma protein [Koolpinyah virus]AIR95566.1 gamma protein [Koolpinyah virus]